MSSVNESLHIELTITTEGSIFISYFSFDLCWSHGM